MKGLTVGLTHTDRWNTFAALVVVGVASGMALGQSDSDDPYADWPDSTELTGVVRDFRDHQVASGHPDFNYLPTAGPGQYLGIVADELNEQGKPVFASTGFRLDTPARDAAGRCILTGKTYIESRSGDTTPAMGTTEGGAVTSAESFSSWYVDTPGLNMTGLLPITLKREPGTNRYVFDDKLDTQYVDLDGFYMPNGSFFNAQGGNKNWSFTFELDTEFVYERGSGQVFTFAGDDDLWVFIDGKLVIDIGGVHRVFEQTIDLDRLTWLEDGRTYSLKTFFAERYKPRSNFRIETTIMLRSVDPPVVSATYD